ncbi:hypothetical protein HS088_TW19G00677 [Tripterygium wilfordii]|uniref:Uncharacterized protein n=1 Tax=Tripterygium wilfordii TaxID=458696 RepID=A0A7J7CAC0_TRIWF|nr:hypothetical protein HS088_TW19G00677 [Tripterygium wilfordii]
MPIVGDLYADVIYIFTIANPIGGLYSIPLLVHLVLKNVPYCCNQMSYLCPLLGHRQYGPLSNIVSGHQQYGLPSQAFASSQNLSSLGSDVRLCGSEAVVY